MRRIRGFMAATLDGRIAEADHGLGFLDRYPADGPVYDDFYAAIGTVVMGRLTYEVVRRHGDWPYPGKGGVVVATRPIDDLPAGVTSWTEGIEALIDHLRHGALGDGDVWVLGGGRLQQAFIDRGAIDLLQLFIVPEILGAGIPMIPDGAARTTLTLVDVARWGEIACLTFQPAPRVSDAG